MLRHLIQKEFLQIRRNSFMPKIILVFPFVIMCVMPWVMNQEVKNIVVDVVDNDRSALSQHLVHRIEASPYFVFGGQKPTYTAALGEVEQGRADIVMVISPGFGKAHDKAATAQSAEASAQEGKVLIAANAVNGTKGSIGASYLTQIVNQELADGNGSSMVAVQRLQPAASTLSLYNKSQSYKVFMIPALMGILMMMLCGFLPALNIVGEKETGTIEQINVTPVPKWTFILAKLIPYWIVALVVMSLCFVLSWAIYGITCQGSLPLVYLLAVLMALIFSSTGLVVSNYSDTMQQAMLVMWFFVVCLMLLSGLFTPVRSMPDWAYATTYLNPMHYFIDAIRTVFVRGGGFQSIAHQVATLTIFAFIMGLWAVFSYKKNS